MKKKLKVKKILPFLLIGAGLLCLVTALAIEASHFPWRAYLNIERNADAIADPMPIVLSGEDKGIAIIEGDTLTPDEAYALLPGSELEDMPPRGLYSAGHYENSQAGGFSIYS